MTNELSKICSKCCMQKSVSEFQFRNDTGSYRRQCKTCVRDSHKEWESRNKERVSELAAESYARHRESINERRRARYAANVDQLREACRVRYQRRDHEKRRVTQKAYRDTNKEKLKASADAWRVANIHLKRASCSRRDAARKQAIPIWADKSAISKIYQDAAAAGLQVDHIVPLRSKLVCGLHCEQNLRPISATENKSKSNLYWPDMP